jgi:hypothetical protein
MTNQEAEWQSLLRLLDDAELGGTLGQHRVLVVERIEAFCAEYARRMRDVPAYLLPKTVSIQTLFAEHRKNPHRVRTVLQALAFGCSAPVLAMVWMVLLGASIAHLSYEYERGIESILSVSIVLPDRQTVLDFKSTEHWDAAVLRMAGLLKADEAPLIDSFYPLHVQRPRRIEHFGWILRVLEFVRDFGGTPTFCPSVIDQDHVPEVAKAIVQAVQRGWLDPLSGGLLAAARSSDEAASKALAALSEDRATAVKLTDRGQKIVLVRVARYYQRLHSASSESLLMVKAELERNLGAPGAADSEDLSEDLMDLKDELVAVDEILAERQVT